MANLLPIGNQLVIFTLISLPGTVKLFGTIHHPQGPNPSVAGTGRGGVGWGAGRGREAIILEKISTKLFHRLYSVFKQ